MKQRILNKKISRTKAHKKNLDGYPWKWQKQIIYVFTIKVQLEREKKSTYFIFIFWDFEREEKHIYQSQKEVPWAMKLFPIPLLCKLSHFLLEKVKSNRHFFRSPSHLQRVWTEEEKKKWEMEMRYMRVRGEWKTASRCTVGPEEKGECETSLYITTLRVIYREIES